MSNANAYQHPRSAASIRRGGARVNPTPLSPVSRTNAPLTLGSPGAQAAPKPARGIILYIGLDEQKAAADGTNLAAVAQELQRYAAELSPQAQTQAVVALAPEGVGSDIDAVRAVAAGSAATGASGAAHGPVRSRVPNRVAPPNVRQQPEERHGLLIDAPRREVHVDGEAATLTHKEFDLLTHLVAHEGQTLSREDLVEALWDADADDVPAARTIDVHIRRLRGRLGTYSSVVRTIRGGGYRYDEHPDVTLWKAVARRVP